MERVLRMKGGTGETSYVKNSLIPAPKYSKKKGEPLIKGNIYITRISPQSVRDVYVEHFRRDFKKFLKARSEELASDGVMILTLIGREKNGEITSYEVLGMVLKEMVQEYKGAEQISFDGRRHQVW
ncbi:hypothetical protein P8452_65938 [Trifolium repens]|nr:hypothetical protein P8452_65938 [Trifolium repens]